ncbi:uncharacterized oxidoreductase ZK1290.5-like isoform X1 [Homarus americanus]|nr:uncharacterized oxidoreductase ZK1290.5-like isoform X1 [Homarus americanus]XP_042215854.1 uncharacterized oxidoreductase ZK1290.5-like isoform X1 [Homarus americanus]XP_042215856.1 uncharacterized oxidoreductase ZK1290.5-like isoform X1 [Homarus americanus]XP_042215858.1 uncharacterized oxidoreductase ZK1290.5-like isoform X1 [Homarus americanus]
MADVYTNPEKHVVLHNNVKLPVLGLGTSHNGGYSHEAVVYALKNCGYRHIDTAKRYGCETYIAQAIKASGVPREEIFLATKCWPADYGAATTREAFNGSCQRLGTDYLDMYLLHWPDVPSGVKDKKKLLQDTWRTLEVLLDEERARVIGVSNFLEHHLETIMDECSVVPQVNQCEFHPYNNPKKLRAYCAERNIQFEGYSPLAKGLALKNTTVKSIAEDCGKTTSQILIRWNLDKKIPAIPKSTRVERVLENSQGYCPLGNGQILNEPQIQEIADVHNKSPAQVLIRWNLQRRVVCIPKSTKEHRVKENAEVFNFVLTDENMARLDNMAQNLTIMDPSSIQAKIDNPLPDGYKLNIINVPAEP